MIKKVFLIVALLAGTATMLVFGQSHSPRMVYLTFRWVDEKPVLQDFEVVPGHLKQARGRLLPGRHLYCVMRDQKQNLIYEAHLPEPGVIVGEFADETGEMERSLVSRRGAEFVIRVPYVTGSNTVNVVRWQPTSKGDAMQKQPLISLLIDFDRKEMTRHDP